MAGIPVALLNLLHEKRRFVTAIAGVSFSVLLMFMFQGFQNALYDSQVQLLKLLDGEIFLISKTKYFMFIDEQFARRRLYQALAFDGVEAAYPLYIANAAKWKNPVTGATRPMRVLAFSPAHPVLPLPGVLATRAELKRPNTVLIDSRARAESGPKRARQLTELSSRQVQVVGTFTLGTDFASGDGNLIMSDQNFLRYFSSPSPEEEDRNLNSVDIGVLQVKAGTDVPTLVKTLDENLPDDVLVLSKSEFVNQELTYWKTSSNIGFVFTLLTAMSFIVGVILVYQILSTDVADHQKEYATLKAMGYSNTYLMSIVVQEAVVLATLGFIPGFLVSAMLYNLATNATGLLMILTWSRASTLFWATLIMCLLSGAIALRKVQTADPAEVF